MSAVGAKGDVGGSTAATLQEISLSLQDGVATEQGTRSDMPRRPPSMEVFALCRASDRVLRKRYGTLIGYLRSGKLVAQGLSKDGAQATIAHSVWQRDRTHLDLYNGDLVEYDPDGRKSLEESYRTICLGLTLSKPNLPAPALHVKPISRDTTLSSTIEGAPSPRGLAKGSQPALRMAAEQACAKWLIAMMKDSPTKRLFTTPELWVQAKRKWPHLTERDYHSARKMAIHETCATAWGAGGAPGKLKEP
jgi:hypothetical protein